MVSVYHRDLFFGRRGRRRGEPVPGGTAAADGLGNYLLLYVVVREHLQILSPHYRFFRRLRDWLSSHFFYSYLVASETGSALKGVILTHRNLIAQVAGCLCSLAPTVPLKKDDVHFSHMSLTSVSERSVHLMIRLHGGRVGFGGGDATLLDDLQALQPTIFSSVPQILNRVVGKVLADVDTGSTISRRVFRAAIVAKKSLLEAGSMQNNTLADKIVLSRVRESLGGRVRVIVTGTAPICPETVSFLRATLGCHVLDRYGQTESAGGVALTLTGDFDSGHVGAPIACCHIKLVDISEMGYHARCDRGEVCVRGPNVFVGYLSDDAKTRTTIDEAGWLHTGDIGEWTVRGTLRIVGRKEDMLKLDQGNYVAPQKVENAYSRKGPAEHVFVTCDSSGRTVVAVVVPSVDILESWAVATGVGRRETPMSELCQSVAMQQRMLHELRCVGLAAGLLPFEQVTAVRLCPTPFTIENGLLTHTFKLRRPQLRAHFKAELVSMDEELQLSKL
eukprot:m.351657 g.351657  ORF g.351657 m.351657 type:complete len:504 (+) comp16579_c0_seq72:4630-6141(+)